MDEKHPGWEDKSTSRDKPTFSSEGEEPRARWLQISHTHLPYQETQNKTSLTMACAAFVGEARSLEEQCFYFFSYFSFLLSIIPLLGTCPQSPLVLHLLAGYHAVPTFLVMKNHSCHPDDHCLVPSTIIQ